MRGAYVKKIERSLAILVQSLQGLHVVVELKNDTEISGIIENSDDVMNITFTDARQVSKAGVVLLMDVAFVSGSKIRYVHIPPSIDIKSHMNRYIKRTARIKSSNVPNKWKASKNENNSTLSMEGTKDELPQSLKNPTSATTLGRSIPYHEPIIMEEVERNRERDINKDDSYDSEDENDDEANFN